jgi:DNA-binding NtrC family response regulator
MVPSSDAPPIAPLAARRGCILVVEDELFIRLIVSEELRDEGYEVIEAFNADEALAILESEVRVDLIISDVRMPGSMDGMGLLAIVKKTLPKLSVIITSAHMDAALALADGASQFLAKPYPRKLLLDAVREELAKTP